MNTKKYNWILYLISATIAITIAVQLYWNYKNYEENKLRITNEIQSSLDDAIEKYYLELAKDDFTTIIDIGESSDSGTKRHIRFDSLIKNSYTFKESDPLKKRDSFGSVKFPKATFDITSISINSDEKIDEKKNDSIMRNIKNELSKKRTSLKKKVNTTSKIKLTYISGLKAADSIKFIKSLKPIFVSITSTMIKYSKLDSLIQSQLNKKEIPLTFAYKHFKNDTIFYASNDSISDIELNKSVISNSVYLKRNERIQLNFKDPNLQALRRSVGGILISFLLSALIVSCLFYLLRIINKQKELALIKNDLISNITHEFKTPIATVSAAIEAIANFNATDDKEKTNKYLTMSQVQLNKLHQMVEKLLETATLDSENLLLNKQEENLVEVAQKITNKYKLLAPNKSVIFKTNSEKIMRNVDAFHFENAISNLIDNAVKYGGETIEVNIQSVLNEVKISIADNGNGIEKNQLDKIFDKFYRIPKGNTHNVKGFGIGLYYTKKIVEKHNGTISVSSQNGTIFTIHLRHE